LSDVIDRLLQVERDARRIIAEAEEEAARTVDEARSDARHTESEGREAARQEAEQIRRESARKVKEAEEARIEEERGRLPSAEDADPEAVERAARFAADTIARGGGE
jgi:vacuolar-type H+-ATPase subunit H